MTPLTQNQLSTSKAASSKQKGQQGASQSKPVGESVSKGGDVQKFVNNDFSQYTTDAVKASNDGEEEATKYDKYIGMVNLMVDTTKDVQGANQPYANQLVGKYEKLEERVGLVNVVGIRGFTQEDGVVANKFNQYNDTIIALWLEKTKDGSVAKRCQEFHASVDPGMTLYKKKVVAHMPEGQIDYKGGRFCSDKKGGYYRLYAADKDQHTMSYYDYDKDGQIGESDRAKGLKRSTGVQFHRAWGNRDGKVNNSSVGCQVVVNEEYHKFFDVFKSVYGKSVSNWHFRYTLLSGSSVAEEHNKREAAKKEAAAANKYTFDFTKYYKGQAYSPWLNGANWSPQLN